MFCNINSDRKKCFGENCELLEKSVRVPIFLPTTLMLKRFSSTFVYVLDNSSESSSHEPKVVPEKGVLHHIFAGMY